MAISNPQTNARNTMAALLLAARDAGWARITGEIRPDGSVTVDAGMDKPQKDEDFFDSNLRMGK